MEALKAKTAETRGNTEEKERKISLWGPRGAAISNMFQNMSESQFLYQFEWIQDDNHE